MTDGAEARVRRTAALAVVGVTAVWGSTFALSKELIGRLPITDYLGPRFVVAALVLLVIRPALVRGLTRRTVGVGAGLGLLYTGAQLLQFHGLAHTAPTVAAFILGMAVVFTPLVASLLPGHRVSGRAWLAVLVATAGVALMSLRGWSFGVGEALSLLSAVAYAAHVVALGIWARVGDAAALTFVQLATMGLVLSTAGAVDGLVLPHGSEWLVFAYLAVVAGALTLLVQTWAQRRLPATEVAVLMVLEPVWAAAFGVLVWHESLGPRTLGGGALVLAAMLMIVWRPGRQRVGSTRIFAWRSGSPRSVNACASPSSPTVPVCSGDGSTLPEAIIPSVCWNSSGS